MVLSVCRNEGLSVLFVVEPIVALDSNVFTKIPPSNYTVASHQKAKHRTPACRHRNNEL